MSSMETLLLELEVIEVTESVVRGRSSSADRHLPNDCSLSGFLTIPPAYRFSNFANDVSVL